MAEIARERGTEGETTGAIFKIIFTTPPERAALSIL